MLSGAVQCESAIRSGKAELVILSEKASKPTMEKYTRLCKNKGVDFIIIGSKNELGAAIGKGNRTLLAVTDKAFKERLLKEYQDIRHGGDDNGKN